MKTISSGWLGFFREKDLCILGTVIIKTWTDGAPVFEVEVGAAGEEMKHQYREFMSSGEQEGTNIGKIYNNLPFKT